MQNKRSLLADAGLLAVAVIWGAGFAATQYAIDAGLDSAMILLLRFTVAALALLRQAGAHAEFFRSQVGRAGGAVPVSGLLFSGGGAKPLHAVRMRVFDHDQCADGAADLLGSDAQKAGA